MGRTVLEASSGHGGGRDQDDEYDEHDQSDDEGSKVKEGGAGKCSHHCGRGEKLVFISGGSEH